MFVERFMAWSVSAGVDQRAEAIGQLAKTYLNEVIVKEDQSPTEQVFTLYLNDPSAKVRKAMAGALAVSKLTPRALVWSLIHDTTEVAVEIYSHSPLLRSVDLIHAIKQDDPLIQIAIAKRDELNGDVVRALVVGAGERAVEQLLKNSNVVLGPGLKHDIATRLGGVPFIRAYLLEEQDILPATRQMLVHKLSNSLLSYVDENGWGNNHRLSHTANDACNRVAIEIAMDINSDDMAAYVQHLKETAQLTPALLVRAICAGHAALFESAIAFLSRASLSRVQSIVDEGRISAFRALYGRTGLPQSAYPVFCAAIEAWQDIKPGENVLMSIIERVELDATVGGDLFALLGRMVAESELELAQNYDRQLLLEAA